VKNMQLCNNCASNPVDNGNGNGLGAGKHLHRQCRVKPTPGPPLRGPPQGAGAGGVDPAKHNAPRPAAAKAASPGVSWADSVVPAPALGVSTAIPNNQQCADYFSGHFGDAYVSLYSSSALSVAELAPAPGPATSGVPTLALVITAGGPSPWPERPYAPSGYSNDGLTPALSIRVAPPTVAPAPSPPPPPPPSSPRPIPAPSARVAPPTTAPTAHPATAAGAAAARPVDTAAVARPAARRRPRQCRHRDCHCCASLTADHCRQHRRPAATCPAPSAHLPCTRRAFRFRPRGPAVSASPPCSPPPGIAECEVPGCVNDRYSNGTALCCSMRCATVYGALLAPPLCAITDCIAAVYIDMDLKIVRDYCCIDHARLDASRGAFAFACCDGSDAAHGESSCALVTCPKIPTSGSEFCCQAHAFMDVPSVAPAPLSTMPVPRSHPLARWPLLGGGPHGQAAAAETAVATVAAAAVAVTAAKPVASLLAQDLAEIQVELWN